MSRAPRLLAFALFLACFGITAAGLLERVTADPPSTAFCAVDDVRAGMRGTGKTCIRGTKVESFDVEILGVLRNTSPGRDMVLARLSGLNLEKTGVIQGMSGSPVYLQGKLLGAVAYAWPYGKEPIAGITPFVQMREFVAGYERREIADKAQARKIGLAKPIFLNGNEYNDVTVSDGLDGAAKPQAADGLCMVPLRTPLVTSGMSPRSLAAMRGAEPARHGAHAGRRGVDRQTPRR